MERLLKSEQQDLIPNKITKSLKKPCGNLKIGFDKLAKSVLYATPYLAQE
jgi:hypothetical protein